MLIKIPVQFPMLSRELIYTSAVVLMTLFLSACGYHLRGTSTTLSSDLKTVYIQGASTPLLEQFEKTFEQSSIKLIHSPNDANFVINISDENLLKRALSLNSGGRANEFGLIYSLKYQIVDAKNIPLVKIQDIEIKREYYNDQQAILAKDNEEIVIRTEMYQSAVRNIITRAQIELKAKEKNHAP